MSNLKDEQEWQEWQDRIEQLEHEDCNQIHSSTGMCPCCGVEVEVQQVLEGIGQQQVCPSCGWMSEYIYDL